MLCQGVLHQYGTDQAAANAQTIPFSTQAKQNDSADYISSAVAFMSLPSQSQSPLAALHLHPA
jgi:hypothetical protein